MRLRFRRLKEEFAFRYENQGLKQGLSPPKLMVVPFCQDASEKSQGLRFPTAQHGDGEGPLFIHSLFHSSNSDVPGMRDSEGKDPVLVL